MRFLKSTKIRLTLWYVCVLAFILTVFAVLAYFYFALTLYSQTDKSLSEVGTSFEITAKRHHVNKDENKTVDEAISHTAEDVSFKNYKIFVFSSDKKLRWETKTLELETNIKTETADKWVQKFTERKEASIDGFSNDGESFRVHYHPFQIGRDNFYLIVIHPLDEQKDLLTNIRYAFLIIVPLVLILTSFGGYFLAQKSLSPIAEMSRKAEKIDAHNLYERLPVEHEEDELGSLAKSFNRLLERLNLSFEQQKRFMADASHELRTPVAIVRGESEVSLTKDDRQSSEYRETITIMQKEAERMSRIIEDLFTLARADAGENPLAKTSVYIEDILAETIKAFRSIGSKQGISLVFNDKKEMPFEADEHLLRRLFTNLIDNAIKHTKTRVIVGASLENGRYKIEVSDDGEGIPVESQSQIFDRFYRVDKSRSRWKKSPVGSGAGLGLSISRWIAELHNGTLELTRSDPEGTVFTLTFPASK